MKILAIVCSLLVMYCNVYAVENPPDDDVSSIVILMSNAEAYALSTDETRKWKSFALSHKGSIQSVVIITWECGTGKRCISASVATKDNKLRFAKIEYADTADLINGSILAVKKAISIGET